MAARNRYISKDGSLKGVFSYMNKKTFKKHSLSKKNSKMLVVGIGGASAGIIKTLKASNLNAKLAYIDTDIKHLQNVNLPAGHKVLVGRNNPAASARTSNILTIEKIAKKEINIVKPIFSGYDNVLVILGLGGRTGSGILPVITEYLTKQGKNVNITATLPLVCEGVQRRVDADYALCKAGRFTDNIIIIPNQTAFMISQTDSYPMVKLFRHIDKTLSTFVKTFVHYEKRNNSKYSLALD